MEIPCPCPKQTKCTIVFDPAETSRRVPCPHCYGEEWVDGLPVPHGKVLTLHSDGTSDVLEDHG